MLRRTVLVVISLLLIGVFTAAAQDAQTFTGRIDSKTPSVDFPLSLQSGDAVTLTVTAVSGDLDSTLELLDPSGDTVAYNDDIDYSAGNTNSQIAYVADEVGEYTLRVSGFTGEGDFEVIVEFGIAAPPPSSQPVGDATILEGTIDRRNPSVDFSLELQSGDTVTLTTAAQSDALDTTLELLDPSGDSVGYNDDIDLASGDYNSQIVYTADATGEYTVRVGSFTGTGDFELSIAFGAAAPPRLPGRGSTTSSGDLGFTEVLEGSIASTADEVDFDLNLEAGESIILQTQSVSGNLDTILTLLDANGREVASVDDVNLDGSNVNSVIFYDVDAGGTYTARVGAYDGAGDFTLVFTRLNAPEANTQVFRDELTNSALMAEYPLELTAGDNVIIQTQSLSGELDTTLTLYNPQGDIYYENDDINTDSYNYNSAISFTVEDSGTYTVNVEGYNESVGEFLLTVTTGVLSASGEPPVSIGSAEQVERGTITSSNPELEFTFDLQAGETALVQTEAIDDSLDTILTILAPDGSQVVYNDDYQSESYNSGVVFTADDGGTYTAVVSSYGDTTGAFTLAVTVGGEELVDQFDNIKRVQLSGTPLIRETENFIIHYTLEGEDATSEEYVNAAAEYADAVWNTEINEMGWAAPPPDQGAGGDDRFDIYLSNIFNEADDCLYGYASSEPGIGSGDNPNTDKVESFAYTSYLVVDNDYDRDNPVGGSCGDEERALADLHTTLAHEFNHNIQFGYDAAEPHNWLFEAIASWHEIYVAGEDEAATIYVSENYSYPEVCFGSKDNTLIYGHWLFLQSLADVHGIDIVRALWESAVDFDGFEALKVALEAQGDSLENVMLRYAAQNVTRTYPYADRFGATVWREETINDTGEWTFTGLGIQELATNYYDVQLDGGSYDVSFADGGDEMQFVVIGIRGDEADIFNLGAGGTFSTDGYDDIVLAVVNLRYDEDVEDCTYESYSFDVNASSKGTLASVTYTLDASNFASIGSAQ